VLSLLRTRAEPELSAKALDTLNQELLLRLQERGIAVPSSTVIDGRFAIRVANVNHRSKTADFDLLVASVVSIGREIVQATATA
jgi:aromatic-L-amino-acid/L-tryptophan decarboxylase